MGDLVRRHDLIADDAQTPHGEHGPELVRAHGCSEGQLSGLPEKGDGRRRV